MVPSRELSKPSAGSHSHHLTIWEQNGLRCRRTVIQLDQQVLDALPGHAPNSPAVRPDSPALASAGWFGCVFSSPGSSMAFMNMKMSESFHRSLIDQDLT